MALALRYAARSDVGVVRQGNEDSGYAAPRLLIVADGYAKEVLGVTPEDVFVGSPPLAFTFGLGGLAVFPLRFGAAAALATRMAWVADGSDMMGSLRNPAGWNNVFGFRPSYGLVAPSNPGDLFLSQLSTEGPMARTVEDIAFQMKNGAALGVVHLKDLSLNEASSESRQSVSALKVACHRALKSGAKIAAVLHCQATFFGNQSVSGAQQRSFQT